MLRAVLVVGALLSARSAPVLRNQGSRADALLQLSSAEDPLSMLGGGDCFGNVGKMCKPCPSGEQNDCQTLKAACDASFCNPICTKLTWECTVTGSGAFTMLSDKPYQNAICGQIIGYGCSEMMKCCKKDDPALIDWVEDQYYGDSFPGPQAVIPPCKHDPNDKTQADKVCSDCKASVSVSLKDTPENCDFGMDSAEPSGRRLLSVFHARRKLLALGLLTHQSRTFPEIGALKSLQERCEESAKKIKGKLGGVMGKATAERICQCVGCCDPKDKGDTCFFSFLEVV